MNLTKENLKLQKEELEDIVEIPLNEFENFFKKNEENFAPMGTEYHNNVFTNLKKLKNEKPQEVEFIDSDYELVDSFDEDDNLIEKGILRKDIEEESNS